MNYTIFLCSLLLSSALFSMNKQKYDYRFFIDSVSGLTMLTCKDKSNKGSTETISKSVDGTFYFSVNKPLQKTVSIQDVQDFGTLRFQELKNIFDEFELSLK